MPLYEYVCSNCHASFEKLVARFGEAVDCPSCSSSSVEKQLSTFAVGPATSSSATAACGAGPGEPAPCGAMGPGVSGGPCGGGACGLPS